MSEQPVSTGDLRALGALLTARDVADPYPGYARWRTERPVARPRERLFVLSRFADCEAVLANPAFGRAEDDSGGGARSLLRLNPPDHTRLRRLVSRAFTPARVRELAPRVGALTANLLEGAFAAGPFDLIDGLALPLPVAVISELLGIPPADRPRLVTWSHALARSLDPGFLVPEDERDRQRTARAEFAAYLRGLLPARRHSPGGDLISALVGVHDSTEALTEDELIALCILLLVAGHETTRSLIGAVVLALLRQPGELAVLANDPSLAGPAVEEALRYDPPVQFLARYTLRSTEVAGRSIEAESRVLLLVGAASRDPVLGSDPDQFRIRRTARQHLAFGHGIHFCLGAPLARLEAEIALRQLLPLLPRLRIAREPQWRPNMVLRGLEHLWLEAMPADPGPGQPGA